MGQPNFNMQIDYQELGTALGGDSSAGTREWQQLYGFLSGRPGWHLGLHQGRTGLTVAWLFPDGRANLAVSVGRTGFRLYDLTAAWTHFYPTIAPLRRRIETLEAS